MSSNTPFNDVALSTTTEQAIERGFMDSQVSVGKDDKVVSWPKQLSLSGIARTPQEYLSKFVGEEKVIFGGAPWATVATLPRVLTGFVGSFVSIAIMGLFDRYGSSRTGFRGIIASMGASAVLFYAAPESPLIQPRNAIIGSLISALIGLLCRYLFLAIPDLQWLAGALAVSMSIVAMTISKTLHPPAGATSLICATTVDPVILAEGFIFLLIPVLVGCLIMLFIAVMIVNVFFRYPKYWI
jgi:CBS domain-containing membrane protein